MPRATLTLWIDSDNNQLQAGWQSAATAQRPVLKQGDTIGVELHWVRDAKVQGLVMEEVDWSPSVGITLAIGRIETPPTFGTYTLTFGGDETPPIQYDASANDVEDALNALTSITTAGGVTVNKSGNTYRIVFNDAGVITDTLDFNENDLFPTSSIGVTLARTGTPTIRQIYQVAIKQSPVAYTETFVDQDPATPSISVIKTAAFAGDAKIWRLSVYPYPKDGTMVIGWTDGTAKTTAPFLATASGGEVEDAMNAVDGGSDWTVKKVGVYSWDISTAKTTIASPTVNGSGLRSFSAKYCELSLNTVEVENLLGGTASQTAYLEVETLVDGVRQTLIQTPVTFVNDIIDEADYTIVSRSEVMPVDSVVRYDTAQTLTTGQKTQARQNIDAVGQSDITALQATVAAIDGRLSSSEGVMLTDDQYDAITGATTPSATNLFVTDSALSTELTGYSQVNHTHTISNVTGLQTALNGKSDVGHSHTTADITGLTTEVTALVNAGLAGKADLNHTHTISSVTDLQSTLTGLQSGITTLEIEKADVSHTHTTSAISGLDSTLSSLDGRLDTAELNITNIQSDVLNLTATSPTTDEKAAMTFSELPSASNPFITDSALVTFRDTTICQVNQTVGSNLGGYSNGSFDTVHYPYEIRVTIGGVLYAIPARIV